jgi:plastocyanin
MKQFAAHFNYDHDNGNVTLKRDNRLVGKIENTTDKSYPFKASLAGNYPISCGKHRSFDEAADAFMKCYYGFNN